jgi:AraC-like DNA-binding protein
LQGPSIGVLAYPGCFASETVAHIAADLGYTDPGAFSAVFARHTGRRPRDYRAAFQRTDGTPSAVAPP